MTSSDSTPSTFAAAIKVATDAIRTTFAAAIVVLIFFGLALVMLASGLGNLDSMVRGSIITTLIWLMTFILVGLILLRIYKPDTFTPAPQPGSFDASFKNSTVE